MQTRVLYRPSGSLAVVVLDRGEQVQAEPRAMVSMSANLTIESGMQGGLTAGLKRALAGESFFVNTYHAPEGGELTLAPSYSGDIIERELYDESFLVQSGTYLASSAGVLVDATWGGARGFFASESLVLLRCSGRGALLLSSFGAIHEMELAAGQRYLIDSGHIVAFTEGMPFDVRCAGDWKTALFGGQFLMVELCGPGTIMLQTRSPQAFFDWLTPRMGRREAL